MLSEAGLPASPNAPAVPINAAIASGKPAAVAIAEHKGPAMIGTVPKEIPIPLLQLNQLIVI